MELMIIALLAIITGILSMGGIGLSTKMVLSKGQQFCFYLFCIFGYAAAIIALSLSIFVVFFTFIA